MDALRAVRARGRQRHQGGDFHRAGQAHREVLAAEPPHANARHLLGRLEFDRGRPEQALACMKWSIALEPASAAFQHNLGLAHAVLGNLEEASANFREQEALRLRPDFQEAHDHRALDLSAQGGLGGVLACQLLPPRPRSQPEAPQGGAAAEQVSSKQIRVEVGP
jgi:Flp pilus assembly protein TadD